MKDRMEGLTPRRPRTREKALVGSLSLGFVETGRSLAGTGTSPRERARAKLAEILELAVAAEDAGYHRFWLAESHAPESIHPSPEILVPLLGQRTCRIRLGAACELPRYAPLRIVENANLLEALFPGRTDLVLMGDDPGAPSGPTPATPQTDPRDLPRERLARRVQEVATFLSGGYPYGHPLADVRASPSVPAPPQVWLFGVERWEMEMAAKNGFSLCYGDIKGPHRDSAGGVETVKEHYTRGFRRTPRGAGPRHAAVVGVMCAATEDQAWRIDEEARKAGGRGHEIVGTPAHCAERVHALARTQGTREVTVISESTDSASRTRSLSLLAQACRPHVS